MNATLNWITLIHWRAVRDSWYIDTIYPSYYIHILVFLIQMVSLICLQIYSLSIILLPPSLQSVSWQTCIMDKPKDLRLGYVCRIPHANAWGSRRVISGCSDCFSLLQAWALALMPNSPHKHKSELPSSCGQCP